jgi:hypothetical protein
MRARIIVLCVLGVQGVTGCFLLLDTSDLSGDTTADGGTATDGSSDSAGEGAPAECGNDLSRDGKNCGACGHDCLGGACENGECRPFTIATGLVGPRYVAVDNDRVYWSSMREGTVNSMAKTSGPVTVIASNEYGAEAIALSSDRIYWSVTFGTGKISSANKDGTDVRVLASNNGGATGMATADGMLYWISPSCDALGGPYAMPLAGGSAVHLSTDVCGINLALDATMIYYTTGAGYLRKVPRTGLPDAATPANWVGNGSPIGVATDQGLVYFTERSGGLNRVPSTGTGVTKLADGGGARGTTVALVGTVVYFIYGSWDTSEHRNADDGGAVFAVPAQGGPTRTVAAGLVLPNDFAVDDKAIYFTEHGSTDDLHSANDGAIWKVAR